MSERPESQVEFDYRCDETDWAHLRLLITELKEDFEQRRSAVLRRVILWETTTRIFQKMEIQRIVLKETPSVRDRDNHRSLLAYLIGSGAMLVLESKNLADVDWRSCGASFSNLSAAVDELRFREAEYYGDMTEGRRKEILADVFGPEQASRPNT